MTEIRLFPRRWAGKLHLGDVFHNDDLSFTQIRDVIAERIRKATWFNENDAELEDVWSSIAEAESADEFDVIWSRFYDWCDDNSVWVETWAKS